MGKWKEVKWTFDMVVAYAMPTLVTVWLFTKMESTDNQWLLLAGYVFTTAILIRLKSLKDKIRTE